MYYGTSLYNKREPSHVGRRWALMGGEADPGTGSRCKKHEGHAKGDALCVDQGNGVMFVERGVDASETANWLSQVT